jgi:Rod binding domain-containing protein
MDAGGPRDVDALRRAAQGLEAALIRRMLQAMEKAQLQSGLFGGSSAGKTRQTQFQMMLSEALAEQEPFGISEAIVRQLGDTGEPARNGPKKSGEPLKNAPARPMSLTERTLSPGQRTETDLEEQK